MHKRWIFSFYKFEEFLKIVDEVLASHVTVEELENTKIYLKSCFDFFFLSFHATNELGDKSLY